MTLSKIKLAHQGPQVSRIALGFWRLADWRISRIMLTKMIEACLDWGLTTFDHADIYGDYSCENLFGAAFAETSCQREKIQLVTKCGIKLVSENRPAHAIKHYDTSKAHIKASVENSLKMLRTHYIDLLLIHRPDPLMNVNEMGEAFTELKQAGKVQHFGVSNFTPAQFESLAAGLDFPLVTNQVEFSLMNMDVLYDGTVDLCQRLHISPMAWSPFGGGRLFRENSEQANQLRKVLSSIGEQLDGASMEQVALAWILHHPVRIIPILGTGKMERIKSAVQAEKLQLSREQWFAIWSAAMGKEVP
ncbi:MAG: aldo/keto reductase family oxidoreductase [bacterium]